MGEKKTKDKILRHFFWPNSIKEIENYVRSSDAYQKIGKTGDRKIAALTRVPIIKEAFSKLSIDLTGPLIESKK